MQDLQRFHSVLWNAVEWDHVDGISQWVTSAANWIILMQFARVEREQERGVNALDLPDGGSPVRVCTRRRIGPPTSQLAHPLHHTDGMGIRVLVAGGRHFTDKNCSLASEGKCNRTSPRNPPGVQREISTIGRSLRWGSSTQGAGQDSQPQPPEQTAQVQGAEQ